MSLQPGTMVTSTLRLVRLIGRGAMGSVWLADHLGLQSQVAVKFMAPAVADDEVSVQRFRQEAKAAAEIRSPHVVQVFDHGRTEDGQLYIVMELLEGASLDKWVKVKGPLGVTEAAGVVTQACKALAKAHERGIFHRDIKPANIFLIDGGGEAFVKVLDFGVAKFTGEEAVNMTAAGNMVGTPAFMSPEQLFHGKEVDHRGDLWSLAVVTYFALLGKRPFVGKTLGELCISIKHAQYVPPTALRPELPAEIDGWFARAFHDDIALRFQSAKELAQEFELASGISTVMQSTPSVVAGVHTFPGTSVSSTTDLAVPQPARRWPVVLGALGAAALGMAGAVVLVGGPKAATPDPGVAPVAAATGEASGARASDAQASDAAEPEEPIGSTGASAEPEEVPEPPPSASAPPDPADAKAPTPERARPPRVVPRPSPPAPPPSGDDHQDDRSKNAGEQLGI